jgi:tRNA dimethylallyltransferase
VLRRRIAERVRAMLDAGLVDEVQGLLARGVAPDAAGLDAVGYREVVQMVQGRLPAADLEATIVAATGRYAKRQETWFRHQLVGEVVTLDATRAPATLAAELIARWEARG